MKAPQWVRLLVSSFAVMSVVWVMAVMACAPASQSGSGGATSEEPAMVVSASPPQSGGAGSEGEKPMPTPTATPYITPTTEPAECKKMYDWSGTHNLITVCPPSGHESVDYKLRSKYNLHMEDKAARHARGETSGGLLISVVILTSTVEAVDDVVTLLESNGARHVSWSKQGDGVAVGGVGADINVELVPAVAEIEGVQTVYEEIGLIYPRISSSGQVVPRQVVPTLTAAQVTQVDQWHRAGFTGAGVAVGVREFRQLKTAR